MIGHGSPIGWHFSTVRAEPAKEGCGLGRRLACALVFAWLSLWGTFSPAEEIVARVRLAWGSGNETMQRWSGEITCEGGSFSELQPLGIEADEAAAIRIDSSRLSIEPLIKRHYDGCDVTVRAPRDAVLRVKLRSEQAPEPRVIEAPLEQIVNGQFSEPLDEVGSRFQAHRTPGDKLRVIPSSDSMVFAPNERWSLRLQPDLAREVAAGPVLLNLELQAFRNSTVLWRASQLVSAESAAELSFDINCPAKEDVYRVSIEARAQDRFAERLVPWQQAEVFASRVVEFVVVDPAAKLPPLTDDWLPEVTIDPANPGWWERMPNWTQMSRLSGRPPGAIGNVRPVVRPLPQGDVVELPATRAGSDPYWQAYSLPVRQPDTPHLIEVEYPSGMEQHLSISIVEPDAAGRVTRPTVDSGVYTHESSEALDSSLTVHRIVFWPHTRSPQLLLVNRHETQPAQFGRLRLLRHDSATAAKRPTDSSLAESRLVAGYLSLPNLASQFGAAEVLDSQSGLSLHGWKTFFDAARRYAQYLKLTGRNGALVTVAAEGSGIYPSKALRFSPKFDTGLQASAAQDPTRKDVLELLFRIFDREGLRLVPTVEFSTPLPALESVRNTSDPGTSGIELVNHAGLTYLQQFETIDGRSVYYNPLNETVQQEMTQVISELAERYHHHRSMAGVAVQVSGRGYSMLPGSAWAVDDDTFSRFAEDTGFTLAAGDNRFLERARALVGPQQEAWHAWRCRRMANLYKQLAVAVGRQRSDLRLLLTSEEFFAGQSQRQQLRESLNRPVNLAAVLQEYGLDLELLDAQPQVTVLNPYRSNSGSSLQQQALDRHLCVEAERGLFVPTAVSSALVYHEPSEVRLASFDAKSPYGAEQTHLTLASTSVPSGTFANRHIASELARRELNDVVQGGVTLPIGHHDNQRDVMTILRRLPAAEYLVDSHTQQPFVIKVYREDHSTTVLALNLSQWPAKASLPMTLTEQCQWSSLGIGDESRSADELPTSGTLSAGNQKWSLQLEPYAIQAWRFASGQLRVDEPQLTVTSLAVDHLKDTLDEIGERTGNLDVQRPYLLLQNPGFELQQGEESIFGWQQGSGPPAAFSLAKGEGHNGEAALRAVCGEGSAVSIESHPFAMPATGELTISISVNAKQMADDTKLYIVLQDDREGSTYQQYAVLNADQLVDQGWAPFEFPVSDVPLEKEGRVRVQFHLVGQGELLIDDVELFDLRFDNTRRGALVKRVYAARQALEDGRVVDCQRLLESYWARHLMEYVAPRTEQAPELAKQPIEPPVETPLEEEEEPGFGDRLKNWVPSIWR